MDFLRENFDEFYDFFSLNQHRVNKIPIRNAIPANCIIQDNIYPSKGFLSTRRIYKIPARIKTIPPTISCFQDIHKTINKINTGTLCINNPMSICQKLNSEEITSRDINAKKRIKSIAKILGVQYRNLLLLFSTFCDNVYSSLNTLL